MAYVAPLELLEMTARERWKWAFNVLANQKTAWYHKPGLAYCFYASDFDIVQFHVDEYGFIFGTIGEKYMLVKRRKTDNHAYFVSRFGVNRVGAWDDE